MKARFFLNPSVRGLKYWTNLDKNNLISAKSKPEAAKLSQNISNFINFYLGRKSAVPTQCNVILESTHSCVAVCLKAPDVSLKLEYDLITNSRTHYDGSVTPQILIRCKPAHWGREAREEMSTTFCRPDSFLGIQVPDVGSVAINMLSAAHL